MMAGPLEYNPWREIDILGPGGIIADANVIVL
jgi:hypothetical protein